MKAFFLHALPSRFKTMMWQYFWNHDVWIRMNWKNYTDFGAPFSPLVSSDQGAYSSDMSGWTLDSTQDDLCPSYKSTGNFWLGRQWQFHLWHIGTISFLVNKLAKKGRKFGKENYFGNVRHHLRNHLAILIDHLAALVDKQTQTWERITKISWWWQNFVLIF